MTIFRSLLCVIVGCLVLVSAACGSNPTGPSNQPEIANNRDNFQFQMSNLRDVTQTLTYTWENTGTIASVNQSGQVGVGSATLTIRDASGTQVYTRDLATTGTFATTAGTAGNWRIEVKLNGVTGALNFRVQKP